MTFPVVPDPLVAIKPYIQTPVPYPPVAVPVGTADVEGLVAISHPVRAIWEVAGTLDLTAFEEQSKSREGRAGRPCWSPRLLVSVSVYAYSIGVASARAIERLMEHEPGMRWLTGMQVVNYHTLADFRVGHEEALNELFAQFIVLLDCEGVLDLTTILHDGTKVQAVAGLRSYHRRKTLEKRLRKARQIVKELDRRAAQELEAIDVRRAVAQWRAAEERLSRMTAVLKKLKKIETETPASKQAQVRVSQSEPEARNMKQPGGGFALSYNVQVSTEANSRRIVAIGVTTAANDTRRTDTSA